MRGSLSWRPRTSARHAGLEDARRAFFNARYETAAYLALGLQDSAARSLDAYEVRTSALHFLLRNALGTGTDKERAFEHCVSCATLLKAFLDDTAKGQAIARAQLDVDARDTTTLFYLGKLNLNCVWLHIETLGRKTGWREYWDARRRLDAALRDNPRHTRARVARAWVDYIVGTRLTRGTMWVLGGGSKKAAPSGAREAAAADSDFYARVEAEFALWEMLVRDRQLTEATTIVRRLAREFLDNHKMANFLKVAPGA